MNPPNIVPGFPTIQTGAPSGAPGNAPMNRSISVTASGIPLGGTPVGGGLQPGYGGAQLQGPMLRDIAPVSGFPMWAKLLAVFAGLGVILAVAAWASKRR